MTSIDDQIVELLGRKEVIRAVQSAFREQMDRQIEEWNALTLADRILRGRGYAGEYGDDLRQRLEDAFRRHVIDRIGNPPPITEFDLASIAIAQLTGCSFGSRGNGTSTEFQKGYDRLCAFILSELQAEREGQKRPFIGWFDSLDGAIPPTEIAPIEIWKSPTGFTLIAHPVSHNEMNYFVTAFLHAGCSELAMTRADSSFGRVVESVALSIRLSVSEEDCVEPAGDLAEPANAIGSDSSVKNSFLPLRYLTEGDGRQILVLSLSAYCRGPDAAKDTLMERLRNATILLSEADRIGSDPLALALSCAAIEALVCEKDELPVTKQIKRHVATLLIPTAPDAEAEKKNKTRRQREKVIDKLYTTRCDVLHGNKVEASSKASECVRKIAAGVIRAIVCWRTNQECVGGDMSWKEIMDEINAATRKPAQMVGVPDLSELIPNKVPS